jgi:hypothetical protein
VEPDGAQSLAELVPKLGDGEVERATLVFG